ncbi:MAG TPA: ABC transporter substrate-binding protein [Candidatus Thermoplasmatota archaeon]|nr:ABC transporter substrate-binding protein [Candidatus Thermoplasmatota archaeon]
MRRTLTLLLTTVLAAAALAGCAGTNTPTPATGTPTGGTTPATTTPSTGAASLTLGTTDTITSLDPGNAYEYLSINVLQNTMGTLLANKPDAAELQPELATALPTISADGLSYSFTLKSGLKYNDGTPIKAGDFLWALERNADKVGGVEGGPAFLIYDSPGVDIANSTAPDDTHLTIKLKQPGVFFNSLLVFPNFAPLPKDKYTTSAFREPTGTAENLPVSSGPYQLSEYRQGEYLKLTKNPNYSGFRTPKTDTVTIKIFSTSAALKSALQNGEVDAAYRTFTPDEWTDLAGKAGVKTAEQPGPSPARYLAFNVNKTGSGMEDQRVRQAIAYIVDRADINDAVFSGSVTPLYSIVVPGLVGAKESYKTMYGASPNLDKAKTLLEAAGYSASHKLAIDLWFNSDGHYGDTEADLATVLKDQLDSSGYFTVTLQSKPWAEYKKDFRQGNFAMFLIGWFPDYLDTDDYISPFLTKGGAASFGTFYDNATLQPLIKAEQAESDQSKRIPILQQIQDATAADNPMLPLFSGKQQAAYRDGVGGVTLSPTNVFPYYTLTK